MITRSLRRLHGVFVLLALGTMSQLAMGQSGFTVQRLANVRVPDVTLRFDTFFDPSGGTDPTKLTPNALRILAAHRLAQQQVELAIQFLEANRSQILSGGVQEFNSVFGNISQPRPVAVLVPTKLGDGSVQAGGFSITSASTANTGTGTANQASFAAQLREGDFIFVGDPTSPTPPLSSRIARVQSVTGAATTTGGATGGAAAAAGGTETIELDRFGAGIQDPSATLANQPIYKVLRFELQPDTTTFDRILETFRAIRRGLSGLTPTNTALNPFDAAAVFSQQPVEYRGNFTDFSTIWGPGVGELTSLNGLLPTGLIADRRLRQAGLSRSDSALHIQNLADIGANSATLPLLWSLDNDLPLDYGSGLHQFGTVLPVGGAPIPGADRLRAFFNQRQTLFGEPNNPLVQYVGEGFLQERFLFKSPDTPDFFDTTIASNKAPNRVVVFETDQNGNVLRDNNGNPIFTTVTMPRTARIAAAGGDIERGPFTANNPFQKTPTELSQWQMIVQSFAEHNTDFVNLTNVAAVGVMDITQGIGGPAFRALDAANYARFAALLQTNGSGTALVDPSRIEPVGKRAIAGFNPVVPRF